MYIGYHHNNDDLRKLMLNEAEQLVHVVNVGAEMSVHSLDLAEQLTADRLLDNARLIEKITRTRIPAPEELRKIAEKNNLHMISILDRDGNYISRTEKHVSPSKVSPSKHRSEVFEVLSGKSGYKVIGFMGEGYYSGMRYGVVVGGKKVGAVVVNTESEKMLDLRKEIGMGSLFKRISVPENVRYIVLQDTLGIIASSPGITQMSRIGDEPFLLKAAPGILSWRFIPSGNGGILEIVQPLVVDDVNIGLIRIGLDTSVFRDITNRAKKYFLILFLIAVITATLLSIYLVQRQNYTLLNQEHDRILMEVRNMEEDARRTERLASMGKLAAGVAHEIRNPLNSIDMLVQLLDSEFEVVSGKEQYSSFLISIKKEIARISIIVGNFLKFSRPPELGLERVAVKRIVDDVMAVIGEKAKALGIGISQNIDPGIVCVCDIDQMKQVILNLLLNALDAVGSDGFIVIDVESKAKKVILKISDSGPGIPEEAMGSIFDPYFTTKDGGVGLGLSEVHRIVTMHNGTISAKNTDSGAVFTITLPHTGKRL